MPGLRLAPGVGFEPTRPEGPQADSRAFSRHGPARFADCPVPGSGIPALEPVALKAYFPLWETGKTCLRRTGVENPSHAEPQMETGQLEIGFEESVPLKSVF